MREVAEAIERRRFEKSQGTRALQAFGSIGSGSLQKTGQEEPAGFGETLYPLIFIAILYKKFIKFNKKNIIQSYSRTHSRAAFISVLSKYRVSMLPKSPKSATQVFFHVRSPTTAIRSIWSEWILANRRSS